MREGCNENCLPKECRPIMFCCFYKAFFGQSCYVVKPQLGDLQLDEGYGLFGNNGEVG